MPLIDKRFQSLFVALFAGFCLFGTSMTAFGAALPRILADFQWSYMAAGIVLATASIAYFVSTFASGHLVRTIGPQRTMMLGLTLAGLGLTFFASSANPWVNAALNLVIGIGQGNIEIAVNSTMLRLDERNTGRPMNLMHGAFAIGAIAGPLALGWLMHANIAWALVFRSMGVLFIVMALLFALQRFPAGSNEEGSDSSHAHLSARPAYWLAFVALFLYVGVELGVSNWVAEYFVKVFGWAPASSALLVSLFWAGLLAGRFGVPIVYRGHNQGGVLVFFSVLTTISVAALAALGWAGGAESSPLVGIALVFLSGLGCSVFYPVVITLIGICFPFAQSRAVGFAATGGGIGAFVFPFAMSALSEGWGVRTGFAAYGITALAMTGIAIWLAAAARVERTVVAEVKT